MHLVHDVSDNMTRYTLVRWCIYLIHVDATVSISSVVKASI